MVINTYIICLFSDLYLLCIFDRSNGLFKFVLDVVSDDKFGTAIVKAFEIIYTLINTFSTKTEQYIFGKYFYCYLHVNDCKQICCFLIEDINDNSLKVVQGKALAKVKSKALDILLVSFTKVDRCLENQEKYTRVFDGITLCLMQAVHPDSGNLFNFKFCTRVSIVFNHF